MVYKFQGAEAPLRQKKTQRGRNELTKSLKQIPQGPVNSVCSKTQQNKREKKREKREKKERKKREKNGEAGHRSQCLSHAKRALYHLSYIPDNFFFVSFWFPILVFSFHYFF